MEFYKLYKIIHHRTDWYRLWRWQREIMMPEWYEEKNKLAEQAIRRLHMMGSIISDAYGINGRNIFYE